MRLLSRGKCAKYSIWARPNSVSTRSAYEKFVLIMAQTLRSIALRKGSPYSITAGSLLDGSDHLLF